MPAVVRGGRRQQGGGASRGRQTPASRGRNGRSKATPTGLPAKMAAIGRLDMSARAVGISLLVGVLFIGGLMATGARAERVGHSVSNGVDSMVAGMGFRLGRVHVTGASAEATPAIQAALDVTAGQSMSALDLDALLEQVRAVSWVKEARIVRLLPGTLLVEVVEHDRLAIWQANGQVAVIDGEGQVIHGADPRQYLHLPLVVGTGAELAAADILPLIEARPRLRDRTEALVRVDERRWDIRLKDGGLIRLPAEGTEAALIQLDALDQRHHLFERGFELVDLKVPGTLGLRPAALASDMAAVPYAAGSL
jgi:cell division protein FtsQ